MENGRKIGSKIRAHDDWHCDPACPYLYNYADPGTAQKGDVQTWRLRCIRWWREGVRGSIHSYPPSIDRCPECRDGRFAEQEVKHAYKALARTDAHIITDGEFCDDMCPWLLRTGSSDIEMSTCLRWNEALGEYHKDYAPRRCGSCVGAVKSDQEEIPKEVSVDVIQIDGDKCHDTCPYLVSENGTELPRKGRLWCIRYGGTVGNSDQEDRPSRLKACNQTRWCYTSIECYNADWDRGEPYDSCRANDSNQYIWCTEFNIGLGKYRDSGCYNMCLWCTSKSRVMREAGQRTPYKNHAPRVTEPPGRERPGKEKIQTAGDFCGPKCPYLSVSPGYGRGHRVARPVGASDAEYRYWKHNLKPGEETTCTYWDEYLCEDVEGHCPPRCWKCREEVPAAALAPAPANLSRARDLSISALLQQEAEKEDG